MRKIYLLMALAAAATTANAASYGNAATSVGAGGTTWTAALPDDGSDFSDTFTFTLNTGSGAVARFSAVFFDWAQTNPNELAVSLPKITFSLALAASPSSYLASQSILASQASLLGDAGLTQAVASFSSLTSGTSYTLTVEGKSIRPSTPNTGSYYLGTDYSVQIAAVPEPETYAMLVAGLGVLGAVARRRRAAKA